MMKKYYTLMMATLVAVFSFAQQTSEDQLLELPEGVETHDCLLKGTMFYVDGNDYEVDMLSATVQMAVDGTTMYVQGMSYWFAEAWVQGTVVDGQVLFPSNQFVGEDEYGPCYLVGGVVTDGTGKFTVQENIIFDYDAENGVLKLNQANFLAESSTKNAKRGISNYCTDISFAWIGALVEVPEGIELTPYRLTGHSIFTKNGEETERHDLSLDIYVGFDGDDVYIRGLNEILPGAWVRGTRKGNTITMPTGQCFGVGTSGGFSYVTYFLGTKDDNATICDVVFTLADDGSMLTTPQRIVVSNLPHAVANFTILADVVLTRVGEDDGVTVVTAARSQSTARYSLSGRPASRDGRGVYIQDGRKIVTKP